eukprot:GILK01002280.1.p1 GENE.GILK01002280.1~~GILK01002280.1.p1  ORF type:complete len:118 (-),score=13.02 GILK01002280.1:97-405(-)
MAAELTAKFHKALDFIKTGGEGYSGPPVDLSNEQKLMFYGLFKQATEGKCTQKAPSRLKPVDRYKWESWNKLGSISKDDAMRKYLQELEKLAPGWSNPKSKL